jgi:hypothetical protein
MLSLLVSAGSLCVAYLAWRRTGVYLRLRLRQNARELGILLDGAITMLASARQSHLRVLAMEGLAQSDNAQIFEQETAADDVELRQLRDKARVEFREFDLKISDSELETKLVDAHGMRKRVEQIRDKYLAVLAQDDLKRAARQREVGDRGNRSRP